MNSTNPDVRISYIKTKNKLRKIVSYRSNDCELRKYHQQINDFLEQRFIPSIFSKGYVKGRSIYDNAQAHMYNDYFIMLDIKDFFYNICHKQLSSKLFYEINITQANQISQKECNDIVSACSVSKRGIPLGFITSPLLSNVYLKEFDGIFYGKLKQMALSNVIYTRYADDLTISFKTDCTVKLPDTEWLIVSTADSILKRYGLHLNGHKTRSYNLYVSNHVRITGINVIKDQSGYRSLTIGRSIKKQLYWDALRCLESKDGELIQHVKGIQSFIISVEKQGYEDCYSSAMKGRLSDLGYKSLKQLIDAL